MTREAHAIGVLAVEVGSILLFMCAMQWGVRLWSDWQQSRIQRRYRRVLRAYGRGRIWSMKVFRSRWPR